MPEIGFGNRIPSPIGGLEIFEDDAGIAIFPRIIAPDVKVPVWGTFRRTAGSLKPGVLIGCVIEDQFGDDAKASFVGELKEGAEIVDRPVAGIYGEVVGDVIAIVLERRGIKGQ